MVFSLVIGSGGKADALSIEPNTVLPNGLPGFALIERPPNPNTEVHLGPLNTFFIGFNSVEQNPGPPNISLDLTDTAHPFINNTDQSQSFSIFWGMIGDPDLLTFSDFLPPNPCIGDPNIRDSGFICSSSSFRASFGSDSFFDISFDIIAPQPIDPASWVS